MNLKSRFKTIARLLALVAISLALANGAWAASITWGAATTIAGDADVATSGTLNYAYAEANTGTPTVNGVPFIAVNRQTTALGVNATMTGFTSSANAAFTTASAPFSGLTSSYQNILIGAIWGGASATVTLKNLTVGRTYLVQFWVSDPRSNGGTQNDTLSSTGGNSVTLRFNTAGAVGGLGQYAIGTFTADATSQTMTIASVSCQMNAIQVRDVTTVWNNTSGGTWSTTGNWTSGTVASGVGVAADFSTLNITADTTVHLDSALTIGTLLFGDTDTSTAAGWILDDNGNSANILTLGGGAAPATISVGALGTGKGTTISAVLAGTVGLTKAGSGTLTLSGANTFSGATLANAGTLLVQNNLALQNSAFDTSGAGTLTVDSTVTTPTFGGLKGTTALTLPTTVTALTLNPGTGQTPSYSGILDGGTSHAMTVTKTGAGTQTLSGANAYGGNTTISAGTLALTGSGAIASSPNIELASGATFDVSGLTTALTLASTQTLKADATGASTTSTLALGAKGLTLSGASGSLTFTTYGAGSSIAPLTISGSTALALNSTPVTVTTTAALAAGTYTLIAKGGTATVTGSPGTLTVNGSGLSGSLMASLIVSSGQLLLVVGPTIYGATTATAFTTTYGTASTAKTFPVSGVNLTANLTATAPTGFQVSSDGTTYGTTATFTESGGSASGTLYVRLAATATVAGTYNSQNIVLSSASASSVNVTTASSGNTVSPKALTITANSQSKTYGTTQSSPVSGSSAFTPTGLQNGETVGTVTLTYGAGALTASSAVGSTSTITPSAAAGGTFTAGNYTITYASGTLTVTAAPLTITATGPSKTYSMALTAGTSSANFTASATQNGETVASVTLTPNAAGLSATTAAGAAYVVTPSAATGSGGFSAANYNITYTPFNGTVGKASATVVVTPYSVVYDGNAHSATVTSITGVNGETGATVGTVTLSTTHTSAGTYTTDSWSFMGTGNYNNIGSTTITDTINQATPTVTVTVGSYTYSGSSQGPNTYTTSPAGDTGTPTWSFVGTGSTSYGPSPTEPTTAGTYTAQVSLGTDNNNNAASSSATAFTINQANTSVGASSSENPSGYKDSVSFTATLPADATGSVVFSSTNGAFSTNTVGGVTTTSLSITNLPRGTNLITVAYLGDPNYLGSTNTVDQTVTNHPPVATVMTVTRTAGLALIIALSDLATNWTDNLDGDQVSLTGVTMQTTNGVNLFPLNWSTNLDGSIVSTNTYAFIGYTNSPNVADQISYSISDGFGGTNIGYVDIAIQSSVTGTNSITAHDFTSPYSNTVTAYGIPSFYYVLERATNLISPVWVDVQTNQAATNGVIKAADTFWDLSGIKPNPSAFYQLKWQP